MTAPLDLVALLAAWPVCARCAHDEPDECLSPAMWEVQLPFHEVGLCDEHVNACGDRERGRREAPWAAPLRALMATPPPPAASPSGDVADAAIAHLRLLQDFAHEQGFHENGTDAVETVRDALTAERRARGALAEALGDARSDLDRDRTGLAKALGRILDEVRGRAWIADGRGCYEWNDDRYKEEAGNALRTVEAIAKEALCASGTLAIPAVLAADRALAAAPPTPPVASERPTVPRPPDPPWPRPALPSEPKCLGAGCILTPHHKGRCIARIVGSMPVYVPDAGAVKP